MPVYYGGVWYPMHLSLPYAFISEPRGGRLEAMYKSHPV